jgi:hypothetical protein
LKVGNAVRVRLLTIVLVFGALSVAAEAAAEPVKRVPQESDESLGTVVMLRFDYASSSFKPRSDGTYSARLHCSNPNQVIFVKFPEAGLAYMRSTTHRLRAKASGCGGAFAFGGGPNAYAVYARPYAVHRRDADGAAVTETAYLLVGTRKIDKLDWTYYQW